MGLTPKQQSFVDEYLVDLNAKQAAVRAGYSRKTAEVQGSRLLRNAQVRKAVNEGKKERSERTRTTADEILLELRKIALADIAEAFDDEGRLRPLREIPAEVRKAISGVEVSQEFEGSGRNRYHSGDLMKVKFWEKTKALELLGKHLRLFTDRVQVDTNVSIRVVDPYAEPPKSGGKP